MADSSFDSERTALLFFDVPAKPGGPRAVTGFYHDEEGRQYRVVGTTDSVEVTFRIVDTEAGTDVGEGHYRRNAKPAKNPRAPVAYGELTFCGVTYPVAIRPASFRSGKLGHTVFPDKRPAQGDAPF